MKHLLAALLAASVLVSAVALSKKPEPPSGDLQVKVEDHNPWTNLRLNKDPADFRFAIVSDRTGGARPGVFERAVEQLNLLQPEFVISVGDLIEGASKPEKINQQWREFDGFVARLQMPFFYLPGNHDISNAVMDRRWREKFGRRYYHFVYKNVLFLLLNTEEPPRKPAGYLGKEQLEYVRRALEVNRGVRWTVVVMHKPLWTYAQVGQTGWPEVEKALADRPYTVFAGHKHHYQRFLRNGRRYYMLGTTGGSSKLRGARVGEVDHLVWVTMKKDGPVLANLLMDGIYAEDMKTPQDASTVPAVR